MSDMYDLQIQMVDNRIATLNAVIAGLEEGLASNDPWVKPEEENTREYELRDFIAQRDALVEFRNTLELGK